MGSWAWRRGIGTPTRRWAGPFASTTSRQAPPPDAFVSDLRRRGVPISVGAVIVATVEPYEQTVLASIRDLGLELQVIFNKGAVMVVPATINKASGLKAALDDLGLSPRNAVAIGDAENDHALLKFAELGVAVGNALPSLREQADLVIERDHGAAVVELIERLIADDLRTFRPGRERRRLVIGRDAQGQELCVTAAGAHVLVAGAPRDDIADVVKGLVTQLHTHGYQFCVLDATGAYSALAGAIIVGSAENRPDVTQIVTALERPDACVVADLSSAAPIDRREYLAIVGRQLLAFRAAMARPHWLIMDPADPVLSVGGVALGASLLGAFAGVIAVTAHPERVASEAAALFDNVLALGAAAPAVLEALTDHPEAAGDRRGTARFGDGILWRPRDRGGVRPVAASVATRAGGLRSPPVRGRAAGGGQ